MNLYEFWAYEIAICRQLFHIKHTQFPISHMAGPDNFFSVPFARRINSTRHSAKETPSISGSIRVRFCLRRLFSEEKKGFPFLSGPFADC